MSDAYRETGLHVFWTKPWQQRGSPKGGELLLAPLEQFVLVASALVWRHHSGPCKLYTDLVGEAFLREIGLIGAWSSIDTNCLENPAAGVDASVFWDFGKTLALLDHGAPATLMDLDLIVWRRLPQVVPVTFYHWEEIEAPWYVTREELAIPPGYQFDSAWDWRLPACNTALIQIADSRFLSAFCSESSRYVLNNPAKDGAALPAFLFSGQRLFSLTAASLRIAHAPVLPYIHAVHRPATYPSPDFGPPFEPWSLGRHLAATHLWSKKHELRRDAAATADYASAIVRAAGLLSSEVGRELETHRRRLLKTN